MTATGTQKQRRSNGVADVAQWKRRAVHKITLPSGFECVWRHPDMSRLIRGDVLPERLRAVALRQAFGELELAAPLDDGQQKQDDQATALSERYEMAKEIADLYDTLILEHVVEPKLTADDLRDIPAEDRDFFILLMNRERATDAAGRWLGVEPLNRWESFRRQHNCAADCQACEALRDQFSTADRG